jgi:hypothetical protein
MAQYGVTVSRDDSTYRGVCVPRSIGKSSCRDTYTQFLRNIKQSRPPPAVTTRRRTDPPRVLGDGRLPRPGTGGSLARAAVEPRRGGTLQVEARGRARRARPKGGALRQRADSASRVGPGTDPGLAAGAVTACGIAGIGPGRRGVSDCRRAARQDAGRRRHPCPRRDGSAAAAAAPSRRGRAPVRRASPGLGSTVAASNDGRRCCCRRRRCCCCYCCCCCICICCRCCRCCICCICIYCCCGCRCAAAS